ncbi:MAG: nuclear transport factor 2 family protein [Alphaproteobacteria bacterium]|nr:nuclear transport factor 2 family protein [Alphaproteobacteria bacterium]
MAKSNVEIAKEYCTSMSEKNIEKIATYLHPDVEFLGPLSEVKGKEKYCETLKGFMDLFKTYDVRVICSSEDHVMLAYDVEFFEPAITVRTAALLTIQDNLIQRIELFFDARPFDIAK